VVAIHTIFFLGVHPEFFKGWWGGLALSLYIIYTLFYIPFYKNGVINIHTKLFAYKYHYSSHDYSSKVNNIELLVLSSAQNIVF